MSLFLLIMLFLLIVLFLLCCSMYCLCVNVHCTVLLLPGVNPTAVNKYINTATTATRPVTQSHLLPFCILTHRHWLFIFRDFFSVKFLEFLEPKDEYSQQLEQKVTVDSWCCCG